MSGIPAGPSRNCEGKAPMYSLTRSIIYDCPAIVIDDSLVKIGNAARVIVLKGATQEDAALIANALRATRCAEHGHVWVGTGDERVVCGDCDAPRLASSETAKQVFQCPKCGTGMEVDQAAKPSKKERACSYIKNAESVPISLTLDGDPVKLAPGSELEISHEFEPQEDFRSALEDLYSLIHDMGWSAPDNRYHSITRAAALIGPLMNAAPQGQPSPRSQSGDTEARETVASSPAVAAALEKSGLYMPPGILTRLIAVGQCQPRFQVPPEDARFLAGLLQAFWPPDSVTVGEIK